MVDISWVQHWSLTGLSGLGTWWGATEEITAGWNYVGVYELLTRKGREDNMTPTRTQRKLPRKVQVADKTFGWDTHTHDETSHTKYFWVGLLRAIIILSLKKKKENKKSFQTFYNILPMNIVLSVESFLCMYILVGPVVGPLDKVIEQARPGFCVIVAGQVITHCIY